MKKEQLEKGISIQNEILELSELIEKIRDKDHSLEVTINQPNGHNITISPLLRNIDDIREFAVADLFDQIFRLERSFSKL